MLLPPDSHTVQRLEHATPEHLHLTTRRTFIGPIPEGWLNSHRKQWYKRHILPSSSTTASRTPTFIAAQPIPTSSSQPQDGGERAVAAVSRAAPAGTPRASTANDESARPSSQSAFSSPGRDGGVRGGSGGANNPPASSEDTFPEAPDSHVSLLGKQHRQQSRQQQQQQAPNPVSGRAAFAPGDHDRARNPSDLLRVPKIPTTVKRARFSSPERSALRRRAALMGAAARGKFRRKGLRDGEILKMDTMLVRTDVTRQGIEGGEFDEKIARGVEAKTVHSWREVIVVARAWDGGKKGEQAGGLNADAVVQFYETRVIASDEGGKKKRAKVEIALDKKGVGVDLFSSLDKTLCIWTTKSGRTTVHYLRPQSGATSVEWYTFMRAALGHKRSQQLQVHIPDLAVSLRLTDPFRSLEASRAQAEAAEGDEAALTKAVIDEQGAAGAIVERCFEMLRQTPDWDEVLKAWAQHGRVGLVWRRYDRLEWIYGAAERKMYGTIGMQKTHELELRPKDHYPTFAKPAKAKYEDEPMEEPPPVEGFLVRLTSQQGQDRRMGKMLFKRLYFTSQDRYLVFLRPSRATPPPPPKTPKPTDGTVPSKQQFLNETPISYDIEPYPLTDGEHSHASIAWAHDDNYDASEQTSHDAEAAHEAARNREMLLSSDGFICLSDVKRVRDMHHGATPADDEVQEGPDVDFHESPDTTSSQTPDGDTREVDDDRTFELLLKNGLVIRLQAYNEQTKNLWKTRLAALITYWKHRTTADMSLYRQIRQTNLRALQIDERAEAYVGQFAYKWEVSASHASTQLYNLCGISNCRPIHLSGTLFRKPRRHTTFTRAHCLLTAGHLLLYQDTLRKSTGKKLVHIHHERIASVDLNGCYVYSGSLTENDLLYQNQTFDSNTPGRHALPRVWLEDDWTSADEDSTTTFVVWQAKTKSWFRGGGKGDEGRGGGEGGVGDAGKGGGLKRVGKLGAKGRSLVFKARSRAERDHWVLALQVEIERLAGLESGDVVGEGGDGGVRVD
ncbi:hypothetical protein MBLNU230_g5229t1 [Neophaeotheca triangularis]